MCAEAQQLALVGDGERDLRLAGLLHPITRAAHDNGPLPVLLYLGDDWTDFSLSVQRGFRVLFLNVIY
jgi:hypothetical protein